MPVAYIGVGSNVSPEENIARALELLSEKAALTAISTFYRTAPFDRPGHPFYCNGAVAIETFDDPRTLKYGVLRGIEKRLGRVRGTDKSAPRTIDLDLLIYGDLLMDEEGLVIPDPDIIVRPFVAVPLGELADGLIVPGLNRTAGEIARGFGDHGMKTLNEFTEKLRRNISHGH